MIPTGTVSLLDIQSEFTGSAPISLSEYYVDGPSGYVISGQFTAGTGTLPTSGPISLADFQGASNGIPGGVTAFGGVINNDLEFDSPCTATLDINPDGTFHVIGNNGPVTEDSVSQDLWYTPVTVAIGATHWVRATLTSGELPSAGSSLGTWLALNVPRTWQYSSGGGASGNRSGVLLLEISSSPTGTPVLTSGSVSITVFHNFS